MSTEVAANATYSAPIIIEDAVFPRDLPSSEEDLFLSIFGHAGGWKWAMHESKKYSYAPSTFWFTPAPNQDDRDNKDPCRALHQFLTPKMLQFIFGTTKVHDNMKKSAAGQAIKRHVPALTVYVLATPSPHGSTTSSSGPPAVAAANPSASTTSSRPRPPSHGDMESDVAILFKDIPVRIFRLKPEHFFTAQQHVGGAMQPIMTAERLAALYGAKGNHPSSRGVLIIHSGDVLSYSAVDEQGRVVGGGISPGIKMRFRALFDYSAEEDFPKINWVDLKSKIIEHVHKEDVGRVKQPFKDTFSVDIEDGVVVGVLSEVAVHCRNVVKQFLAMVTPVVEADTSVEPPRTPGTVLLEGQDNDFLSMLLGDNASDICPMEPGVTLPTKTEVEYICRKNLTAYGIQRLLVVSERQNPVYDPDEKLRDEIVGLRGARVSTADPKSSTTSAKARRGTFVAVRRGNTFDDDMFELLYDDNGDKDYVTVTELYDSIRLYLEVGEDGPVVQTKEWAKAKKAETSGFGETLVEANKSVRQRKAELDGAYASDGSIVNLLAGPNDKTTVEEKVANTQVAVSDKEPKAGEKRARASPQQSDFIGRRVAKYFDEVLFFGTVDYIHKDEEDDSQLWHVHYDDGDEEDFDYDQLKEALLLHEEMQAKDDKKRKRTKK